MVIRAVITSNYAWSDARLTSSTLGSLRLLNTYHLPRAIIIEEI